MSTALFSAVYSSAAICCGRLQVVSYFLRGFDSVILPLQNVLCAGWLSANYCELQIVQCVLQPELAATICGTPGWTVKLQRVDRLSRLMVGGSGLSAGTLWQSVLPKQRR
jgi:hypothetical protein